MDSPQVVYVYEGEVEKRLWQEGRKESNPEFATTIFAFWWQKNWNQYFYNYKKQHLFLAIYNQLGES